MNIALKKKNNYTYFMRLKTFMVIINIIFLIYNKTNMFKALLLLCIQKKKV